MERKEQIRNKARELGQVYFPDSANIWARSNVEAVYVENACVEMAEWMDRHPGWASVEKELPPKIEGEEITKYYLVAGLNGEWYDVLRYDYRDGRWSDHYGAGHACVTHWMEIVPPAHGKEE